MKEFFTKILILILLILIGNGLVAGIILAIKAIQTGNIILIVLSVITLTIWFALMVIIYRSTSVIWNKEYGNTDYLFDHPEVKRNEGIGVTDSDANDRRVTEVHIVKSTIIMTVNKDILLIPISNIDNIQLIREDETQGDTTGNEELKDLEDGAVYTMILTTKSNDGIVVTVDEKQIEKLFQKDNTLALLLNKIIRQHRGDDITSPFWGDI